MESTEGGLMQMARSVLGVNELKKEIYLSLLFCVNQSRGRLLSWASLGIFKYQKRVFVTLVCRGQSCATND